MNLNIYMGRLTKDVELKYITGQNPTAVARFSLALNRGKDKNGNDRGADYPTIVAFGRTAENLEKFSGKGLRALVYGHVQTGSYDKDGVKHYTTETIADRIEFIDWKDGNGNTGTQGNDVPEGFSTITDNDIPF